MNDIEIARRYVEKAKSASERNIPFVLSFAEYKRIMNTTKCYYTSVELTREYGKSNTFTLDRIDASVGYIPGNVVACSHSFNQRKRDLTMDDMRMIFKKIKRRL